MNVSLFDIELAAFATGNLEDSDNNDNYRPLLYDLYFFLYDLVKLHREIESDSEMPQTNLYAGRSILST